MGARLARLGETARSSTKGFVIVFESQLRFGLRSSIFCLLREVIEHYELCITQIFPLGLCRTVAFDMACKEAKVERSLNLFRHYCYIKRNGRVLLCLW